MVTSDLQVPSACLLLLPPHNLISIELQQLAQCNKYAMGNISYIHNKRVKYNNIIFTAPNISISRCTYKITIGNWSCLLTGALENASSNDRRAHRLSPPFLLGIYLKNLQRNDTAPLRPIALRRSSQWRYHQILRTRTVQILSHSQA